MKLGKCVKRVRFPHNIHSIPQTLFVINQLLQNTLPTTRLPRPSRCLLRLFSLPLPLLSLLAVSDFPRASFFKRYD